MDFKEWVEYLMKEHRNPTVKSNVKKSKVFSICGVEDQRVEERLASLKRALQSERVDRRCARNKLAWLNGEGVARVSKKLGSKSSFMGFTDKSGSYLYPEEVMFLLEINRAEISWNSVPINIDMAFTLTIGSLQSLNKYKVYKKLMLKGFTLKRIKDESNSNSAKKFKKDNAMDPPQIPAQENSAEFVDLFRGLQKRGPQYDERKIAQVGGDYKMSQVLNGCRREFNLKFICAPELDPEMAYQTRENNIYCSVDNDVLFSKFVSVKLPFLF